MLAADVDAITASFCAAVVLSFRLRAEEEEGGGVSAGKEEREGRRRREGSGCGCDARRRAQLGLVRFEPLLCPPVLHAALSNAGD